ncbi:HNH endonuclease family protein [Rummeliibacillus sp. JY-2-4R]
MPQSNNLSSKWVNALGANWEQIHGKYLHTIGNLTLTRYNGEMGNKFFTEKRDMENGFKGSPCRLNTDLIELETWNEEEILKRANRLFEVAKNIWVYPEVDFPEENYNMILDFDDDWKNIKPEYFTFMEEKHEVKNMTDLYVKVISEIYQLDPELLIETVNSGEFVGKNYISKNPNDFRSSHKLLETGFYINTNSSSDEKKKNLLALIKAIGLTENDLVIYLSNSENDSIIYVNS